ncbi:MAG: GatB/YqeY domain-containing protein [Candidatus Paceibacterota bacterium]|jgi:hypothetical protein
MTIHESIEKSIPEALRANDEVRLRTLRSLFAAMTNDAIAKNTRPIDMPMTVSERIQDKSQRFLLDQDALVVLRRAANQREDSIRMFEEGGRTDLAEAEKAELMVIESYLPTLMSREEIEKIAKQKMVEHRYSLKADTGVFIGTLMRELKGRADGSDVKAIVDNLLS